MTDRRPAPRPRRPGPLPVVAASLATFLALLAFLALQLRAGRDPALGAGKAATQVAARRVLVRRIEKKVVVVHTTPSPTRLAATGSPAPVVAAPSAPAPAPAATPAPPPPPPPPPPVTRTS